MSFVTVSGVRGDAARVGVLDDWFDEGTYKVEGFTVTGHDDTARDQS